MNEDTKNEARLPVVDRYSESDGEGGGVYPDPNGAYMEHATHEALITELRAEVERERANAEIWAGRWSKAVSYGASLEERPAQLQAAPAGRGVVRQETNFVASTGEGRNPLYEGQFDDETPEQAAHRLHWSHTAMEVQSARLNPAPATAEQPVAEKCMWTRDEDTGAYRTGCGSDWHLADGGLPEEHGQYFCHHCGKQIDETEASHE